jgi:hypothetical protein
MLNFHDQPHMRKPADMTFMHFSTPAWSIRVIVTTLIGHIFLSCNKPAELQTTLIPGKTPYQACLTRRCPCRPVAPAKIGDASACDSAPFAEHDYSQWNCGDRADQEQRPTGGLALFPAEPVGKKKCETAPERGAGAGNESQFGNGYSGFFHSASFYGKSVWRGIDGTAVLSMHLLQLSLLGKL